MCEHFKFPSLLLRWFCIHCDLLLKLVCYPCAPHVYLCTWDALMQIILSWSPCLPLLLQPVSCQTPTSKPRKSFLSSRGMGCITGWQTGGWPVVPDVGQSGLFILFVRWTTFITKGKWVFVLMSRAFDREENIFSTAAASLLARQQEQNQSSAFMGMGAIKHRRLLIYRTRCQQCTKSPRSLNKEYG